MAPLKNTSRRGAYVRPPKNRIVVDLAECRFQKTFGTVMPILQAIGLKEHYWLTEASANARIPDLTVKSFEKSAYRNEYQ
ncbi:hypothetical protein RS3R6_39350 [Pseudomonas atacamensis]|uniref:Uncharacterized protein n=1 Tax=Pseudomonas atacamensis TaxID=2565368 RepID=A0ABQ5PNS1_9PSED|nr:hypothetical protein RS3R1_43540 [Pseudomonas atacamensis]GLH55753.1 hypothetical protein RS3R6_39350 [Pseudomonas atacamensis]